MNLIGDYWHKNTKEQDTVREDILKEHGYIIFNVKESDYYKNKNADLNASINLKNRLMNVSLNNSKLHSKDSFGRLLANTKNKYIIKDSLQKNFSG